MSLFHSILRLLKLILVYIGRCTTYIQGTYLQDSSQSKSWLAWFAGVFSLWMEVFCFLYKSWIRPLLEYANTIWHPRLKRDINAIENVQRRATKMIPGMSNLSYPERLQALRLPTLSYRRARGDMIETYKLLHHLYNIEHRWLLRGGNTTTRGHTLKLSKSHCKLELRKHCFSFRIVNPWNSLPEHIISAPSLNCFKNRLDAHWKDNMFLTDC